MKKIKHKIKFYKSLVFEIIETLCTICMYLENDAHHSHNPQAYHLRNHICALKHLSKEIGEDIGIKDFRI